MAIEHPNLTATASTTGVKSGVPGGVTTIPGGTTAVPGTPKFNTLPTSPLVDLGTRFRPPSFLQFHANLSTEPEQASRNLDAAIQRTYENSYRLEKMVACTQHGEVTVTGSVVGVPTGLSSLQSANGSIDNGSTPHSFTLSVSLSQVPGAIDIHVFQPTATNNVTPVTASSAVKVRWTAVGGIGAQPQPAVPGVSTITPLTLGTIAGGGGGFTVDGH